MKVVKRIFDFYINSSIHVALAVCSLSMITMIEFELPYDSNLILFTFLATIVGYNFVKYFGLAKFHHRQLANWLKYIQIFSLLCILTLVYFVIQLDIRTLFYIAFLGLITFFYAIPFLPKSIDFEKESSLRAITGLKIYVIAFVWMFVTVILPLINAEYILTNDTIITAIQRFLFVIVATLPFEIRDMQFDSLKLGTIPQKIGIKPTKIIGVILMVVFNVLEFMKDDLTQSFLIISLVITIIMLGSLLLSAINQSKYYSAFWVEGIPIIWLWLLFLVLY